MGIETWGTEPSRRSLLKVLGGRGTDRERGKMSYEFESLGGRRSPVSSK